jgi:hypothetical protein
MWQLLVAKAALPVCDEIIRAHSCSQDEQGKEPARQALRVLNEPPDANRYENIDYKNEALVNHPFTTAA